ncbi:hypothetical protein ACH4S9_15345 [Streptomyces sp. NPDC021225]|uniref:hypothetical protein n=1 Tax=Streptomyces sp. NPDC021225 TaxID=3365121 RepID=UPI0037BD5B2A
MTVMTGRAPAAWAIVTVASFSLALIATEVFERGFSLEFRAFLETVVAAAVGRAMPATPRSEAVMTVRRLSFTHVRRWGFIGLP